MKEFPQIIKEFPLEIDKFFNSYRLDGNKCDVYFSEIQANAYVEPHSHPNDVISIVCSGKFILKLGEQQHSYLPGELAYIPKNETHSVRTEETTKIVELWLKN